MNTHTTKPINAAELSRWFLKKHEITRISLPGVPHSAVVIICLQMPLLWEEFVGVGDEFMAKVKVVTNMFILVEATNSLGIAASAIVAVATIRAATALVVNRVTIAIGFKKSQAGRSNRVTESFGYGSCKVVVEETYNTGRV